jgi:hypothetical protein
MAMADDLPAELHWLGNKRDISFTVANYITFEIYEGKYEYNEYFNNVLEELEQTSSRVNEIPQAIIDIVDDAPLKYEINFCAMGDLNRDKYNDAILILGGERYNEKCWILTGTSDNSYKISAMNDNISLGGGNVEDKSDFEQPYFDIVIKNGFFTIEEYIGPGSNNMEICTAHFKYSKEDDKWLLFRKDYIPNRFYLHNCCCDYHQTQHFVEKMPFETLETIYF